MGELGTRAKSINGLANQRLRLFQGKQVSFYLSRSFTIQFRAKIGYATSGYTNSH